MDCRNFVISKNKFWKSKNTVYSVCPEHHADKNIGESGRSEAIDF